MAGRSTRIIHPRAVLFRASERRLYSPTGRNLFHKCRRERGPRPLISLAFSRAHRLDVAIGVHAVLIGESRVRHRGLRSREFVLVEQSATARESQNCQGTQSPHAHAPDYGVLADHAAKSSDL